jgi:spore coat polysaccharide biosynthesis protein SpsF
MEVGPQNNNGIGAIIQARMGSTRLPGKILMPLPFNTNKPLLAWPIAELKKSRLITQIVLATADTKENLPLLEIATQYGIGYYAGSEENVLERFCFAGSQYNLYTIVRVTGDNPFIDIDIVDKVIGAHLSNNNDYSYTSDLPIGMNVEVVNLNALKEVNSRSNITSDDIEHVTFYFKRDHTFKTEHIQFKDLAMSNIRLTADHPADYATLNIVAQIADRHLLYGIELVKYIEANYKWVLEVNNNIAQRKQFTSPKDEFDYTMELLKKNGLFLSEKTLHEAISKKVE